MKKVGILYICTGEYIVFWKDFYKSFEKNFLNDCEVHYFVFTDTKTLYGEESNNRIHRIVQKNLGWPDNTLFRYHMFLEHRDAYKEMEYLFFINGTAVCEQEVKSAVFLPEKEKLLFVQHPGYYNVPNYLFPYERRKKSTAYVPYSDGKYYVCGGVNGGKKDEFLNVCKILKDHTDEDYCKEIIALWHDESQINRFVVDCRNFKLLSPEYCYPEGEKIPFCPIIVMRDKSKMIDVDRIKKKKTHCRILVDLRGIHSIIKKIILNAKYGKNMKK